MLVKRWLKWDENQKSLAILVLIAIVGFCVQIPLFLIHDNDGFSYGAYPLGWLLGSLIEIIAFISMDLMVKALGRVSDKTSGTFLILGSFVVRFLLYIVGLIISAICTFVPEIWGGFSGFNFFTCFAALLPFPVVTWIFHYLSTKKGKSVSHEKEESHTPSSEIKDEDTL